MRLARDDVNCRIESLRVSTHMRHDPVLGTHVVRGTAANRHGVDVSRRTQRALDRGGHRKRVIAGLEHLLQAAVGDTERLP